jgi:hypothetical protein
MAGSWAEKEQQKAAQRSYSEQKQKVKKRALLKAQILVETK